jgi:hypothetical protein
MTYFNHPVARIDDVNAQNERHISGDDCALVDRVRLLPVLLA